MKLLPMRLTKIWEYCRETQCLNLTICLSDKDCLNQQKRYLCKENVYICWRDVYTKKILKSTKEMFTQTVCLKKCFK